MAKNGKDDIRVTSELKARVTLAAIREGYTGVQKVQNWLDKKVTESENEFKGREDIGG